MKLRLRDNALYWFHRSLAAAGGIRSSSLEDIQREGFRRILVVATTAIGDAVLCTPLIDSLRAGCPKARIGFWVSMAAAPLFEGYRGLDAVHPYPGKYRKVCSTMEPLRKESYDLALVANANDPDVIPMIWWSGCKRIIRRPQRHTIYSFMVANPEMLSKSHTSGHAIERNLQFCDLLKIPKGEAKTRLDVRSGVSDRVRNLLRDSPIPWWVVHPGASRSRKQWGVENYAKVAQWILEGRKGLLILTGSRDEKETCDQIETRIDGRDRVRNLAGTLRLDELAALLKQAGLLISGDTGPFHIAMALGTATVTLFAPWDIGSSPQINGPFFELERHRIVETGQMGDPISTITVEQVFAECRSLLTRA